MKNTWALLLVLPLAACAPGSTSTGSDDGSEGDALTGSYITASEIMQYAVNAGLPCTSKAVTATAIALAESSGNTHASHHNTNGTYDYGLWQINTVHGLSRAYLFDPQHNADAMYDVSSHGTSWTPWSVYKSGAYRDHLSDAQDAFDVVCN